MFPLGAARLAVNVIAGLGVSKVVSDIVKNNTTVLSTADQVMVKVGSLVLGSMMVEKSIDHVNTTVQSVVDHYTKDKEVEKSPTE